jgi:hypothetical protein
LIATPPHVALPIGLPRRAAVREADEGLVSLGRPEQADLGVIRHFGQHGQLGSCRRLTLRVERPAGGPSGGERALRVAKLLGELLQVRLLALGDSLFPFAGGHRHPHRHTRTRRFGDEPIATPFVGLSIERGGMYFEAVELPISGI